MLIFNMQPFCAIASCLLLWLRDDDQAMMMMSEAGGRYRWLMMPSMVGIMHASYVRRCQLLATTS
jgi:hypothetical protein